MRIISVRQFYADLIVNGIKPVENRDWPTSYRGTLLIHASKSSVTGYEAERRYWLDKIPGVKIPAKDSLQYGGIVGVVEMSGCVRQHKSPWFEGQFGFVMQNAKTLPFLPCHGKLGLWLPTPAIEAHIKKYL